MLRALALALALAAAVAAPALALPICPASGKRSDCVHDGDTWWIGRTKYRHADLDTPEIGSSAMCEAEVAIGLRARDRLSELMAGGFTVEPTGERGGFGRDLAFIRLSDGREAGEVLVGEGLAVFYKAEPDGYWCRSE